MLKRLFCCCRRGKRIEWAETVPFVPPVSSGTVIKVYDGDTITVASRLPYKKSPLYRFRVRLARIDAPEIKGKTKYEKECAVISRDELASWIYQKRVHLKQNRTEKYGRLLAEVYCEGVNVSDWMLARGYAVPYDGGKKATFSPSRFLPDV